MLFNIEKCKVLRIGSDNQHFRYYTDGPELEKCTEEKRSGCHLYYRRKVITSMLEAYNRASRILRMIQRTTSYKIEDIMLNPYKTLVRQHLEFCTPVWSPNYKKDKTLLEKEKFNVVLPV